MKIVVSSELKERMEARSRQLNSWPDYMKRAVSDPTFAAKKSETTGESRSSMEIRERGKG